MKKVQVLILIALVFGFGTAFLERVVSQDRADDKLVMAAEKITGDEFPFSTKTPKGATVYSVRKAKKKILAAIDQGLADLIAVARKNGYTKRLNFADYTIFIAKADRTEDIDKNYSPDIAVDAAQYAGSIYDKGGYIFAAGMVLAYTPGAFIIAEHSRNFQRVSEVVRFEGEHIVLYHNDRKLYNETADHSRGGGHPILN